MMNGRGGGIAINTRCMLQEFMGIINNDGGGPVETGVMQVHGGVNPCVCTPSGDVPDV